MRKPRTHGGPGATDDQKAARACAPGRPETEGRLNASWSRHAESPHVKGPSEAVDRVPNKDALLRAVLMASIEVLERDVKEGASKRDGGEKGTEEGSSASEYPALHITSIYLRHALSSSNEQFKSLIRLTLSSLELSELWNERLRKLLQNAHPSDRTTEAYLLRCAADGLWLSMLTSSATDMPEHAEACRILQSQLDILRERLEDPE